MCSAECRISVTCQPVRGYVDYCKFVQVNLQGELGKSFLRGWGNMSKTKRLPIRERSDDWSVEVSRRLADQAGEMEKSPAQQALVLILRQFAEFQADDRRYSFYPADILDDIDDAMNPIG